PPQDVAPAIFIDVCRPLRDPHSFPTRRSSDLGQGHRIPIILWVHFIISSISVEHRIKWISAVIHTVINVAVAGEESGFGAYSQPDRKSTRLNSSHVKISYAVFCLKKKTTLPQY